MLHALVMCSRATATAAGAKLNAAFMTDYTMPPLPCTVGIERHRQAGTSREQDKTIDQPLHSIDITLWAARGAKGMVCTDD
jgi:hypothetical protein